MKGICMWKGCRKSAVIETALDYPKIFVCLEHIESYRKICKRKYDSFGHLRRKRYLKKKWW